jgi:hypothetical protein
MTDAGMPIPALVFWMLMPTYVIVEAVYKFYLIFYQKYTGWMFGASLINKRY